MTLTVTWGEQLLIAAHRAGGLNPVVDHIRAVIGRRVGVRNSFSKLYTFERPQDLKEIDRERAWYLLTALGENPADWGVNDDDLPPFERGQVEALRFQLCTPRDLNPEPTDYGTARPIPPHPRKRNARDRPHSEHRSTGPKGRKA